MLGYPVILTVKFVTLIIHYIVKESKLLAKIHLLIAFINNKPTLLEFVKFC